METNKLQSIKEMLPDYLNDKLKPDEKRMVESYLSESDELRSYLEDISYTFKIIDEIKYDHPNQRYWDNLLPSIHKRINEQSYKHKKINYWKILLPAAAVILIALLIWFTKSDRKELTDKPKIDSIIQKENQKIDVIDSELSKETITKEDKIHDREDNKINTYLKKYYSPAINQTTEDDDLVTLIQGSKLMYENGDIITDDNEYVTISAINGDELDENFIFYELDELDEDDQHKILEDLNNTNL